ncbi:MAG: heat stress-responsive two component signal transduction system response regulator Rre1 [Verrucomicrobiota bacterium]|jgi:DNA-binding response OmpR family regulator|nr:response regulator [Opitutaceae bacterium]
MPEKAPLILLAEDDRNIRETTADLLALCGIRVRSAPTGKAACALFDHEKVDLLITDLVMPEGDGMWLLEQVRSRPDARHVPVILLTAHADTTEQAAAAKASADAYLTKPFDPEHLIETVKSWLDRPRPADATAR